MSGSGSAMDRAWIASALIACAACASTPDTTGWPDWAEKAPVQSDYLRVYPKKAKELGAASSVRLACTIKRNRRLDCVTQWEQHPGEGFGEAALKVSKLYVVKKSIEPDMQPGKIVIVPMEFRLPD
jgi:hypothetical protein